MTGIALLLLLFVIYLVGEWKLASRKINLRQQAISQVGFNVASVRAYTQMEAEEAAVRTLARLHIKLTEDEFYGMATHIKCCREAWGIR